MFWSNQVISKNNKRQHFNIIDEFEINKRQRLKCRYYNTYQVEIYYFNLISFD